MKRLRQFGLLDTTAMLYPRKNLLGVLGLSLIVIAPSALVSAQSDLSTTAVPSTTEQKVEQLAADVTKVQQQMEANQKLLIQLQQQLNALRTQMMAERTSSSATSHPDSIAITQPSPSAVSAATASPASATLEEIRERQAIDESQIATHDLAKVETESKYPLKVTGLVLFNAFVNTRQVDVPSAPAYAIPGAGSTGLSLRQTVLGLDARGPHVFGATSHADVRVDFFAGSIDPDYSLGGVLRLRTAHAGLRWPKTEATVELDRTILEPNAPSSLLAVGQPELAWTGNLSTWNPQIGMSHQFGLTSSTHFQTQLALIDVSDPRLPSSTSAASTINLSERSRWPGVEGRVALQRGDTGTGMEFGIGGYYGPLRTGGGSRVNAWAATIDARLPVTRHFELTANAYRGQALGGLGGGGYVDYIYQYVGSKRSARALDDVGGWAQLKARAGERIEFNAGYGIDNPFAREVASSVPTMTTPYYPGLARNRAFFTNGIWSPSAYLLFSLEYRRMWSNFASGATAFSDAIGIGAGYRF